MQLAAKRHIVTQLVGLPNDLGDGLLGEGQAALLRRVLHRLQVDKLLDETIDVEDGLGDRRVGVGVGIAL